MWRIEQAVPRIKRTLREWEAGGPVAVLVLPGGAGQECGREGASPESSCGLGRLSKFIQTSKPTNASTQRAVASTIGSLLLPPFLASARHPPGLLANRQPSPPEGPAPPEAVAFNDRAAAAPLDKAAPHW